MIEEDFDDHAARASLHATVGAAVTEMKSRPKKTPSTIPVANKAEASGEASAELRIREIARARFHHDLTGKEFAGRRVGRLFGVDQHDRDVVPPDRGDQAPNGGAPAMIQRVMAMAAIRQRSAAHHFPGRIGWAPGSAFPRPLNIGPTRSLPRRQVKQDGCDVQPDEHQQHVEQVLVQIGAAFGRVHADRWASGPCINPSSSLANRPSPTCRATRPIRATTLSAPSGIGRSRSSCREDSRTQPADRRRNWRSAPSSFRPSPTESRKSSKLRIAIPD